MTLLTKEMALKNIFPIVFALSIPLLCARILGSDLSPMLIVLFPLVKILLYNLVQLTEGAGKTALKIFTGIISLLFAAFVIIGIVITPYSSYRIWMESIYQNSPGGTVSTLVTYFCTFFSTHFALLFFSMDIIWPFLGMALVVLSLLAFTYQSLSFFIPLAAVIILSLIYLALKFGHRQNRIRGIVLYVNLSLAALLLALLFSGEGKPRGSSFVDDSMYPFFRKKITDVFPDFPLIYSVPGYGFSFDETSSLGGRPILSPAGIFEVVGGSTNPLYLRTRSFDRYDGKTWRISKLPEESEETLESTYPVVQSHLKEPDEVQVKVLTEYYSYLPHTLNTRRIRMEETVPPLKYGNWDIGFLLEKPVKKDDRIYLQLSKPVANPLLTNKTPYLQIPDDLPDEIADLANRISIGAPDSETILMRIKHYLAINYSYDLEEDADGGYTDFVQSFLFNTLSGYCVHFATAFIILARLNEIPARYTTGFLVTQKDSERPTTVSGLASHAWPEIWLDGLGWTSWEATPALDFENYEFLDDYWLYNLDMDFDGLTARQIRAIMGEVQTRQMAGESQGFSFDVKIIYSAIIVVLGAAAFFVVVRLLVNTRRHSIRGVNRPLLLLASKMIILHSGDSLHAPERVGWIRWRDGVIGKTPELARNVRRSIAILLNAVYGGRSASRRDVRYTSLVYRRMKRHLRRSENI
jgi:transglutaminase-like putative cysteine protease